MVYLGYYPEEKTSMLENSFSLVSIIMPAYNGEKFIKQAIESVFAQTHPDWELIVVDDGSTDNTAKLVSGFGDSRIKYIHQQNRGQAAALNRGLDAASGIYITTLDVDDWLTPNSLGDRATFLDRNSQYAAVYGDGVYCDMAGNPIKNFSELRKREVTGDVFDVMLSNSFFGTGANVMIKRSALEEYQIRYDESIVWCQDYDLYLRLAEKCQFGYVDSRIVWYRLHPDNMTMTMSSGHQKQSLLKAKLKALASERIHKTPDVERFSFFYELLVVLLENDLERQLELMEHFHFRRLPRKDKARLMRICGSTYLSADPHSENARILFRKSWTMNPFDPKTLFVFFVSHFKKGPIAFLVSSWRARRLRDQAISSPFHKIKGEL